MGNLRDQLKQANLLSKKDAKRVAHEERVRHKQIGGAKAADAERAARQAELAEKRQLQAAADRQRELEQQALRVATTEASACTELLRREVRSPSRRGATRFFFVLPGGEIPHLELDPTDRSLIQSGDLCIARKGPPGTHDYGLLATEHGQRIAAVFPDRLTFPCQARP